MRSICTTSSMAVVKKHHKKLAQVIFVLYVVLLFYFLFFAEGLGRTQTGAEYQCNLSLFREIKRYITYRHYFGPKMVFLNLAGNVIAFMPFGFFWPLLWDFKANWLATTLNTFTLSLAAEVVQLVYRLGSFDVDDLLLNTIGGLLGYVLCYLLVKRRMTRNKKG